MALRPICTEDRRHIQDRDVPPLLRQTVRTHLNLEMAATYTPASARITATVGFRTAARSRLPPAATEDRNDRPHPATAYTPASARITATVCHTSFRAAMSKPQPAISKLRTLPD